MKPEARKYLREWSGRQTIDGSAVYGASLPVRTVITLASMATSFLRPSAIVTEFFESEQAARVWIDARRRKLRAKSTV